ncbi:hypothetical protein [Haloarcula pellucida]|uniref:Uncharacterized protein n=1 Tax=Haloarcula pellucida TaxID=1427151 RepID=A0A830GMU9_9EURY|nr:hypothetical protein [Halomicroarcula pellucida]MBX0348691.1 hypothetical protein [Halomicroarcula pellucida]GGN92191.1 hypothetical protein GCM10009030_16180 [Halomicroarcula pellucida]
MSTNSLADPKAIGTDVETLVIDAVDVLKAATDADDHYDAVTTSLLEPSTVDAGVPVLWAMPVVERGERIEIKACVRERSKGTSSAHGSWCFKGRDGGQHGWLVDESAVYVLAVYDDAGASKELVSLAVVPASIVDEHLRDRWYGVDRREETCAQLRWSTILEDGGDGA